MISINVYDINRNSPLHTQSSSIKEVEKNNTYENELEKIWMWTTKPICLERRNDRRIQKKPTKLMKQRTPSQPLEQGKKHDSRITSI